MNLREGCIGKQETAACAWIACWICGLFSMNTQSFYENGNASYLATVLSALLALLATLLTAAAMRRSGCENLAALYRYAFGRALAVPIGLITAFTLVYAAVILLVRLLMIQCRYVYVESEMPLVALYVLIGVLVPAWMGLETVGRTCKLFWKLLLFCVVVVVLIAFPSFQLFRLYPLLGNGVPALLLQSVTGTARYLPALVGLIICGVGVQGMSCAASGATIGAVGGGLTAGALELSIGLTYPYGMLASMHSPMYRLTMAVRTGSAYLRTDKLLLFFWTLAGVLSGGYFVYAAALLAAGVTGMRDIRPAVGVFATVTGALMLMGQLNLSAYERAANALWDTAWIPMLAPPLLAALIAVWKGERAV